jgi:hypothetical protein
MGKPSKPMSKNANSKYTTRNNKQDIFSGMQKFAERKAELSKRPTQDSKTEGDNTNP